MKISAISQHALERYMIRTATKDVKKALKKIDQCASNAVPIGNNEYYLRGVVYVVVEGEVKTAYKPHKKETQDRIFAAFNKR
jgi:hypothetical protein